MRERRPSREELRQKEKEELSRQRLQDQAFLETQRNVFARIKRGEDYWDGGYGETWDSPSQDREEGRRRSFEEREARYENRDYRDSVYETPLYREETYEAPVYRDDRGETYETPPYRDDWEEEHDAPQDRRCIEEDRETPYLNPAIVNMRWEEPERPEKPRRSKKKLVLVLILILALILGGLAAAHQILVHAPALPVAQEEGTHPGQLGADRKEGVYTFLFVGRDDAGGGNTDTIMVGCYDTVNGTADVLSIFRDTLVDVPWEIKKINSVYNVQGIEGLQEQVKNLIGYTPDYYFVMEMSAVAQLVDAIGGVDYEVPYNMDYDDPTQDLHIHFAQGMQHLNGEDAVKVLRWRKNNSGDALSVGDVGRVEIQHDFLKSMAKQTISLGNVTKIRQIAQIVDDNLDSDLSYGEMFWFGEQALGLQEDGIQFHSLPGDYSGTMWSKTYQNYQSYVFVNDGELLDIVNQFMNPYLEDIPAENQHVINGTTVSSQVELP